MTATAAARLRAATRDPHDSLERSGFATALFAGTLPLTRCTAQLAAAKAVLSALETAPRLRPARHRLLARPAYRHTARITAALSAGPTQAEASPPAPTPVR
jgi:heme oxygenase